MEKEVKKQETENKYGTWPLLIFVLIVFAVIILYRIFLT